MDKKDYEAILPEDLKRQEKKEREEIDKGTFNITEVPGDGVFGSFYAYKKGINKDYIELFAISDQKRANEYVRGVRAYLESINLGLEGAILDVGCAMGTLTNAFNKLSRNGQLYGIDISEDAIELARRDYPACRFYCQSADDLGNFEDRYFDIIHARGFYPFTLTDDRAYHLDYLRIFFQKLKPGGILILQITKEDKFTKTYEEMFDKIRYIGYSSIRRDTMIPIRLFKIFGKITYKKARKLFILFSKVIMKIQRGKVEYFYTFIK